MNERFNGVSGSKRIDTEGLDVKEISYREFLEAIKENERRTAQNKQHTQEAVETPDGGVIEILDVDEQKILRQLGNAE